MKRIFSFLIVVLVFILNCVPVFAWTSDNFISYNGYVPDSNHIFIMTENLGYNFYYVVFTNGAFKEKHLVYSSSDDFVFQIATGETDFLQYVNNSNESINILSTHSSFKKTVAANSTVSFRYAKESGYHVLEKIVNSKNECISQNFCDPSIYVDPGSADDYEEDGVVIKGLTSFFNNMISSLNSVKDSILNLPETILNGLSNLFIPNIENMKTSFNSFIDYMTTKFGFNSLIDTLHNLVDSSLNGSSVGAADLNKDFSINYNNTTIPLKFSLPFSDIINDSTKNMFDGYLKGFFFILLIFYNLSEIYFLIRGTRPFNSSRSDISMNLRTPDTVNYTKDGNIRFH